MNAGRAFAIAWRVFRVLPGSLGRGLFNLVAVVAWLGRGSGVRQLEANLARLRPDASRGQLRRLSLAGMRSYMRYYCEAFQLPGMSGEQIDARVRVVGLAPIRAQAEARRSVVMALTHSGNWDLAGAWCARNVFPLVTVAERLKPEELYREFVGFRESLGITVIPLDPGGGVFRRLLGEARTGVVGVPLLADRDLSAGGVDVAFAGHRMRVASGPAALSLASGTELHPAALYYERLQGPRRRAARSPWGLVIEFGGKVAAPDGVPRGDAVAETTQAWVSWIERSILSHPEDWHMLQKVFVADLDPDRQAGASSEAARGLAGGAA